MHTARPIKTALTAAAVTALLTLSACGGSDEETATDRATTAQSEAPTEEPSASAAADPASGDQPAWAASTATPGEKISTFEVGDITVDVHQVGTAPAPKQGMWVDPKTNKPLIAQGDPLVFVNYVVTNNGDAVDLGSSLVNISARYDDWAYAQGMGGITDSALYESQGVVSFPIKPGTAQEPPVYTLEKGQTYSYGENFHHQKSSKITFKATVTPVDAEGELLHDQRVEGEGTGTIE
ncbi:hypothetical protein [Aeromicrobium flavum]|uniref:hypothetical protein n=1 Tax=Aeromicrobium flavum TaxID=416568 RepID=UPI001C98F187|nr:hypothetical protein [Aeromicrobium flavum]